MCIKNIKTILKEENLLQNGTTGICEFEKLNLRRRPTLPEGALALKNVNKCTKKLR